MADHDPARTHQFKMKLNMGQSRMEASVQVPLEPMSTIDLLPVLQSFGNQIVQLAENESDRCGKQISCQAGCGACCRQLVPIAESEAHLLADLVADMPKPRREQVERRFAEALLALDHAGLSDRLPTGSGLSDEPAREKLGADYMQAGVACPFLEEESCSIYPDRPLACREYLVTSPAENCQHPTAESIEMVPLPVKISETLYRFGEDDNPQPARWFPLVLALRWSREHPQREQAHQSGAVRFQQFLQQASRPGVKQSDEVPKE